MRLVIDLEIPDAPESWNSTDTDAKFCKYQAHNYMYLTYAGKAGESREELDKEHVAITQAFLFFLSRLNAHIKDTSDEG